MTDEMLLQAMDSYIRLIEIRDRLWHKQQNFGDMADPRYTGVLKKHPELGEQWQKYALMLDHLDQMGALLWKVISDHAVWPEEADDK